MHTLIAIFSVLFGLAFGSFLNVCISRLPLGESVIGPASRCPRCRKPIRVLDNIPVLSWLVLRGRCHACGADISLRYPAVEAVTASLFLLCFLKFGLSLSGIGAAVLCFFLVGLAVMDAETLLLPDAFTLPGTVLGIASAGLTGLDRDIGIAPMLWGGHPHISATMVSALTALTAAGLVLAIRWTYWLVRRQEGMGLGDVKLMAMIGAWFGPEETVLIFFLAVVCGAIYGLALILVSRAGRASSAEGQREPAPTRVPLGAFLCLAGLFTVFWGMQTLQWYFALFG